MLGVRHIHIGDDVHDTAIGFFRQTLVLAAVARFHMKDGDVQPLCTDNAQAAVGIAQNQHSIWLDGSHQLIALRNNVAHCLAQIRTHGVHVYFRVSQLQIMKEHAVQIVVVVLTGMRQYHIEILASFVDDSRQGE